MRGYAASFMPPGTSSPSMMHSWAGPRRVRQAAPTPRTKAIATWRIACISSSSLRSRGLRKDRSTHTRPHCEWQRRGEVDAGGATNLTRAACNNPNIPIPHDPRPPPPPPQPPRNPPHCAPRWWAPPRPQCTGSPGRSSLGITVVRGRGVAGESQRRGDWRKGADPRVRWVARSGARLPRSRPSGGTQKESEIHKLNKTGYK